MFDWLTIYFYRSHRHVRLWNSTIEVFEEYIRSCKLWERHGRLDFMYSWYTSTCYDYIHPSNIAVSQATQVLLNDFCNRYFDMKSKVHSPLKTPQHKKFRKSTKLPQIPRNSQKNLQNSLHKNFWKKMDTTNEFVFRICLIGCFQFCILWIDFQKVSNGILSKFGYF